jgi:hypothetical protein
VLLTFYRKQYAPDKQNQSKTNGCQSDPSQTQRHARANVQMTTKELPSCREVDTQVSNHNKKP